MIELAGDLLSNICAELVDFLRKIIISNELIKQHR